MPPAFVSNIQCLLLWDSIGHLINKLRDFHPLWFPVPGKFVYNEEGFKLEPHHIREPFRASVQFALFGFLSPLLAESLLVSFPAGTKMFPFPAFFLLTE